MRSGSIRQEGPPREVWTEPADEWVARFVGYTSVHTAIGDSEHADRLVADGAVGTVGRPMPGWRCGHRRWWRTRRVRCTAGC